MLYDNSQLARVYLHAWQVTGNQFFRTITEEILDYVIREMLDPAGGSTAPAGSWPGGWASRSLRVSRLCLPVARCGAGGTSGAGGVMVMVLWSIERNVVSR